MGTKPLVVRGKEIGSVEMQAIREILTAFPQLNRTAISLQVCEKLGWRQPNGKPQDVACREILRTLKDHIHLHCALPGGALSKDGQRWIPTRENFLFSVKALAVVFRGKFLNGLKKAKSRLGATEEFDSLMNRLYRQTWVVYSKRAFAGPQAVLDYFGRYTHRIAISNERLVDVKEGSITFSYRDRRDENRKKAMTLSSDDFIRRFLLHVVPLSFVRVRHFGFLSNRRKKKDLERCRELLGALKECPASAQTAEESKVDLTGEQLDSCPVCEKGHMRFTKEILPAPLPLWPLLSRRRDSS